MTIPVVYIPVPVPDERISIIDSLGQTYYFPQTFAVRSEPIARKSDIIETAYVHGAKDVSDGMFSQRVIEISGKLWANTDAEYNQKWDALSEQLAKVDFRVRYRAREINIKKIEDISHEYPERMGCRFGEVSVRLLALDPFWYGIAEKEKEIAIVNSPTTFQWTIGGKVEVFPIITVENQADNTDFTLENETDGEREFRIQDALNLNGTTVVIDCIEGTVKRGTVDLISNFSGMFLRLLGGRGNKFNYTGGNCIISAAYKEGYV